MVCDRNLNGVGKHLQFLRRGSAQKIADGCRPDLTTETLLNYEHQSVPKCTETTRLPARDASHCRHDHKVYNPGARYDNNFSAQLHDKTGPHCQYATPGPNCPKNFHDYGVDRLYTSKSANQNVKGNLRYWVKMAWV